MIDQSQGEKPIQEKAALEEPVQEKPVLEKPVLEKPALTVVIQSWWTPALAVIMLVVGLLGGYFGRPLLNKSSANDGNVVALVTQGVAIPNGQGANPTATVDPTQAAAQVQQTMASIISQTTNFQGDSNAKVTLIEFSDYQ